MILVENAVSDLGPGLKDAFFGTKVYVWHTDYTVMIIFFVVLLLISSGKLDSLFLQYRERARAKRREERKRAFLSRLFVEGRVDGEESSELLKRLINYYSLGSESAGMSATPEQLLGFSKSIFRLVRKLEYDKRGRLAIPALDRQIEEPAKPEPLGQSGQTRLADAWKNVVTKSRTETEQGPMSKVQRVALSLIRLNRQ